MSLEGRRIALVEDDPVMGESLLQRLSLEGASVHWWQNAGAAIDNLPGFGPDLVICDIRLPELSGEDLFRRASPGLDVPFLFITAYGEVDQAVRLMRNGAGDYVTKPFAMDMFLDRLKALMRPPSAATSSVLGVSAPMGEIESLLRRLAGRNTTVLLTGETGTGKEVCARFMHGLEADGLPFVAVNCAAIPAELMESELFGHERGAFTGAVSRHVGHAERAGEGFLFLDEVGELPLPLQAKLLRLIEERSFMRLGGSKQLPFKARLVCATNTNLRELVAAGRFRDDLYFRINVIEVLIPPLRERRDDILWLLRKMLETYTAETRISPPLLTPSAEETALLHDWPGNVRELKNRVERAMALSEADRLTAADLFPELVTSGTQEDGSVSLAAARDIAERLQIERALRQTGWQPEAAARVLGISRSTLFDKLRRHGIRREDA